MAAAMAAASVAGCAVQSAAPAAAPAESAAEQTAEAPAEAGGEEIIIKLGASSAVTEPIGAAGQRFVDSVNEKLAGRVKVE